MIGTGSRFVTGVPRPVQPFTAAPHDDVLALLIQVAVLLVAARLLGEVARRLGKPGVVGELLAGIILGPSLLSAAFPFVEQWMVPQNEVRGYLIEVVALIGAMLLLLITGLETDLSLIRRHARTAIGVSFGGIAVTFASGFLLGTYLPDDLLGDPTRRTIFALFMATAMSISAIPVIAKVLMEMNLIRRDIGQTIIAAGMSDDTIGWILLSIVAGLASGEAVSAGSVLEIVGSVLAFMLLSFTAGRWLVARVLDIAQDRFLGEERILSVVIVLTFTWGAITHALDLEAVLGAFVMGILLGQMPRLPASVHRQLMALSVGIFTPIFFAVAGLKVNVRSLLEPELLLVAVLVILVATAGKFAGTYAGARLIGGKSHWNALAYGSGLNARGAMEIIIATIGLSLGILSQDMFSIIVLMAMATSLMAPTALRFVLARVEPTPEEVERLRREEMDAASRFGTIRRVLLPVRIPPPGVGSATRSLEARLLSQLGSQRKLSMTLMTVCAPGDRDKAMASLGEMAAEFKELDVTRRVIESSRPGDAIMDEVGKGYDLLVLGAPEGGSDHAVLFTPLVDYLVRMAPCPTIVVQGRMAEEHWPPSRILVPSNGGSIARSASELGMRLASASGAGVTVLNVVPGRPGLGAQVDEARSFERRAALARRIISEHIEQGVAHGVNVTGEVRVHPEREETIISFARQIDADLIVVGTGLRSGSGELFLGPGVERLLSTAPCPVVVVNAP